MVNTASSVLNCKAELLGNYEELELTKVRNEQIAF